MYLKLKKYTLAVILMFSLLACTPADVIKQGLKAATGGNDGISVDAQIGDRQTENTLKTGDENTVQAEKVEGGINYVDNSPSLPIVLLLILGWLLPDPARMWSWLTKIPSLFRRK